MPKYLTILATLLLLAVAGLAQEEEAAGSAGEAPGDATEEAAVASESDETGTRDEEEVDDIVREVLIVRHRQGKVKALR